MSNRRRRVWLTRARVRAIVHAGLDSEIESFLECQADETHFPIDQYKGLVREVFGRLEQSPLEFPCAHQGRDLQRESLSKIQKRNRPRFDLLQDDLSGLMQAAEEHRLWSDYQDDIESACSVFEKAREILAPLRRVNLSTRDAPQWSAMAIRAARSVSYSRKPIFQYASRFGSVLASARRFWTELTPPQGWKSKPLADHEVYALLAMYEARLSVESIIGILRDFDQWADENDVSDDNEETFRDEMARWEWREARYVHRRLAQAKDLQHLAQLAVVGADSERARQYIGELEHEVQQRAELLAAVSPLAKDGKVFSEGRSKGGQTRKGKTYSTFKLAVRHLCVKLGTYIPQEVLGEMRRDCEDDEEGDSRSEVMNDLRGASENPVFLRFQSVPDDLSDSAANIFFVLTHTDKEEKVTVGTFRNAVSAAKPNKTKKSSNKKI